MKLVSKFNVDAYNLNIKEKRAHDLAIKLCDEINFNKKVKVKPLDYSTISDGNKTIIRIDIEKLPRKFKMVEIEIEEIEI